MKKAIVIGASSGIGRELSKVLDANGYEVGVTGRRRELLEKLEHEMTHVTTCELDVTSENAIETVKELIQKMGGLDLMVISAGTGFLDPDLPWDKELQTIETNVTGFTAMANVAYHHFLKQGHGHIVGLSSIAAVRGGEVPAYNASKAFVSNYMQGLRYKIAKKKVAVAVTDVQPGFVDTAMAKGEGLFWVASPEKAALQIYRAIQKKKRHVYVTRRWWFIAGILKLLPEPIYNRI